MIGSSYIEKLKPLYIKGKKSWQLWLFLALTVLAIFILFLAVDLTPQVDGDFFFSSDDPQFQYDKMIAKIFPQQQSQMIISAMGDINSGEYIHRLNVLTEVLSFLPGVSSVKSLTCGPRDVKDAFLSPLWKRLLVSEDGKSSNLIVILKEGSFKDVIAKLETTIGLLGAPDFKLNCAGVPYVVEIIRRSLLHDLKVFTVAAFLIFGIVIVLIFRSARILLGTLISCVDACLLTLIITSMFGIKTGILTVNLSTIIFVLTLSHIVFLTHNWKRIVRSSESGEKGRDYTREAVRSTFNASFWCMITTLLGFLSLLFVQAKPLRELGFSGSVGTLAAILVAYGVYPLFLRSVKPARGKKKEAEQQKIRSFFLASSKGIVIAIAVLGAVALVGMMNIDTDPSLFSYFREGSELREGLEYIDRNGGSSPLKLVLRDAGGEKLSTKETYQRLWQLQEALEKDESVGSIISLPVIMAEGNRSPLAFFIRFDTLLTIMEQPEYNQIAKSFVTDDRISGNFLIRMKESNRKVSRLEIVDHIKKVVRGHGFVPEMLGGIYLLQGELSRLVASSLIFGLGKLIILFIFIALIVSRSPRTASAMVLSLCVIPISMLGVIGHLRVALDIISAPAANVAIAMGIDAMIHMAVFVRQLTGKGTGGKEAWQRAQNRLWEPILSSMFIICAGFGIFSISFFPPTQRFGLSIVFGTILSALTALFVLPFLAAKLGKKRADEVPVAQTGDMEYCASGGTADAPA